MAWGKALIPIILFPIFYFEVLCGHVQCPSIKEKENKKTAWKKLGIGLYKFVLEIIIKIYISFVIFIILLTVVDSVAPLLSQGQNLVSVLQTLLRISEFISYIQNFNIQKIPGNQFSLAGFYFALAIGGTVILSMIDRYITRENSLNEELLEQAYAFKNFYSKKKLLLNLNLSAVIDLNNKDSTKKIKCEDIAKFDKTLKSRQLSDIKEKINSNEVENKRSTIKLYKKFAIFSVITYFVGFITIFIPDGYVTLSFWIFLVFSVIFVMLIYLLYKDYRK